MRQHGRCVAFGVLLLTVGSLLAGTATAAPSPTDSANPRLKYLPKDYWLVAECDVGTVAKIFAAGNAQENPQLAQVQQYIQLVKQFTAIDLEKDVERVTLFLTGTAGEMKMLAVVQGSFKNDQVAKRLAATLGDSLTEKTHKKHTVYDAEKFSLSFPEDSTLLVGDEALVRRALDQADAKTQRVPEALKHVLDRTPDKSVVWAAVQPRPLLEHEALADWRTANGELHATLRKIDCLSLFFELADDGLLIKGLGYVAAPGGAGSVHQYLSNRKKNLLHEEGTNVLFVSLLILSEIKADGPFVEGSFRITAEAFKQLWGTRVIIRPEGRPAESKGK